jgi:Domain of unknown function (DUF1918)
MRIQVGDRLLPDGDHGRGAEIIAISGADGGPPYVVRWLSDGHIALVTPGPYDRILPGPQPGELPAEPRR